MLLSLPSQPHPPPIPSIPPNYPSLGSSIGINGPTVHFLRWCTALSNRSTSDLLYRRKSIPNPKRSGRSVTKTEIYYIVCLLIETFQTYIIDLIQSLMHPTHKIGAPLPQTRSVSLEQGKKSFRRSSLGATPQQNRHSVWRQEIRGSIRTQIRTTT
jgi:hypothetical protein